MSASNGSAPILRVRNLQRYQHYRDRNPPWVKLHRELLEDYDFEQLPDASKAHALLILLLASRLGNEIPDDPEWIARKIGAKSKVDIAKLLESRFLETSGAERLHGASETLADCEQVAMPEREGEGEREKKREKHTPPSAERMALTEFDQLWEACEKKVAKGEARKAYLALRRKGCDPSLDTLLNALKPLQDSHAWSKDGRQFQPNLATWLRREGWLEKPTSNGHGIATPQGTGGEFTRWALIQLEDAGKTFDPNAISAAVDPMTSIKQVADFLNREFNVQPTFR